MVDFTDPSFERRLLSMFLYAPMIAKSINNLQMLVAVLEDIPNKLSGESILD